VKDLVVTWPKSKSLSAYLKELERAVAERRMINFRVPSCPSITPERCYMVHDGQIRGYNLVRGIVYRGEGEVARVEGGGFWPEGWYIVRAPEWHPILPIPMRGFQGYRYIDRP
jgi:hypothetical protein